MSRTEGAVRPAAGFDTNNDSSSNLNGSIRESFSVSPLLALLMFNVAGRNRRMPYATMGVAGAQIFGDSASTAWACCVGVTGTNRAEHDVDQGVVEDYLLHVGYPQ
jgi:hypothetical protein